MKMLWVLLAGGAYLLYRQQQQPQPQEPAQSPVQPPPMSVPGRMQTTGVNLVDNLIAFASGGAKPPAAMPVYQSPSVPDSEIAFPAPQGIHQPQEVIDTKPKCHHGVSRSGGCAAWPPLSEDDCPMDHAFVDGACKRQGPAPVIVEKEGTVFTWNPSITELPLCEGHWRGVGSEPLQFQCQGKGPQPSNIIAGCESGHKHRMCVRQDFTLQEFLNLYPMHRS
jgi:hypothetical protein